MTAGREVPLVAFARELEQRDAEIARGIAEVDALQGETSGIRSRAVAIEEFLASLPARRAEAERAGREAEGELERKRAVLEQARRELAEAERGRKEERIAAATRALARAEDAVTIAERRLVRAEEEKTQVEREAEAIADEAHSLERRADDVVQQLRGLARLSKEATLPPDDGVGVARLARWAGSVLAALFVVRGGLEGERERVVREANELAANLLGEAVSATNVSLVRRRIEAALSP